MMAPAQVPNTWNIINDQDAVPRSGKLVFMYKRPGQVTPTARHLNPPPSSLWPTFADCWIEQCSCNSSCGSKDMRQTTCNSSISQIPEPGGGGQAQERLLDCIPLVIYGAKHEHLRRMRRR